MTFEDSEVISWWNKGRGRGKPLDSQSFMIFPKTASTGAQGSLSGLHIM